MKFIFTDVDRWLRDEYQGETLLSEETGWWCTNGEILIWTRGQPKLRQIGVAVHEAIEYIMMVKLKLRGNGSHLIANCIEFIVSFGTADLCWKSREWLNEKSLSQKSH